MKVKHSALLFLTICPIWAPCLYVFMTNAFPCQSEQWLHTDSLSQSLNPHCALTLHDNTHKHCEYTRYTLHECVWPLKHAHISVSKSVCVCVCWWLGSLCPHGSPSTSCYHSTAVTSRGGMCVWACVCSCSMWYLTASINFLFVAKVLSAESCSVGSLIFSIHLSFSSYFYQKSNKVHWRKC